jgi:putative ABC transport system ATP-binding protein
MTNPMIEISGLTKTYTRGSETVQVLEDLDIQVAEGEFLALMGPSGSGKTTLLNILGGLDGPDHGSVKVGGEELTQLDDRGLASWRAQHVGFIFQLYNLIPVLTAFQNVELPLLLTHLSRAERRQQVELALTLVGLKDRMRHHPTQLSGGQEQRVAIARAIVTDPDILLADEPTGDLDRRNAADILDLLTRLNREQKKTIVMVTHDPHAAERATRTLHIEKGKLVDEQRKEAVAR